MPNSVLPVRYDLPWKAALAHAFRSFMDLYFPDLCAHIDWRQRARFRDKELAGFGIGATPDVMVADKLVEICLRDGCRRRMLIHIEIQAQHDSNLARRVHDYNYRIGKAYRLPVISLVVLADANPKWRPSVFRQQARGTTMRFSFTTAKLLDVAADTDALAASDNPIAWVTLAHLLTLQARHDPDVIYAAKLRMTRLLFLHRWKQRRIIVLFNVINWMMTLPEPHQRRYWRAVLQLEKEHDMKLFNPLEQMFIDDGMKKGLEQGRREGLEQGMEKGLEQGLEQGRVQGLEQGRAEGAVALLARQLTQRFGPLPKTVQKRLTKANVAQVEAWSDALAGAQSLKQVFDSSR